MKKKINVLLYITLIFLTSCKLEESYPEAEWTIMFYLGDDYKTIGLISDLQELLQQQVSTAKIRLTILYDGPDLDDSYLVILDNFLNQTSRSISLDRSNIPYTGANEVSMSSSETLDAYIKYVTTKLPSKNYAIFFGSHGTGYQSSLASGLALENSSDSMLTVTEIANSVIDKNINLIYFDACNLGNIATIYEFKDSVDYIVASPEEIPGPGNDYTGFITNIFSLSELTSYNAGKASLQTYYNYYIQPANKGYINYHEKAYLQQLYDVELISNIVDSELFKSELLNFKNNKDVYATTFNSENYTDIYDLIESKELKTQFDNAITIVDGGLYKWISIYLPPNTDYYNKYNDNFIETQFAKKFSDTNWIKILKQ